MNSSFQFSLLDKPLNIHNYADPAVLTQYNTKNV